MAASGIEILKGQLEQLKAQREQVYNDQVRPLDNAIGHLEMLVDNGQTAAVEAPAVTAKRPRNSAPRSSKPGSKRTSGPRKGNSPKSAKPPASKTASAPTTTVEAPQVEAPLVEPSKPAEPKAESAPTTAAKVKLKRDFKGKSVDEAITQVLNSDSSKRWDTEAMVDEISNPSSKAERSTAIRSVRLILSRGASQGKWQKVSDGPAVYASNDYKVV